MGGCLAYWPEARGLCRGGGGLEAAAAEGAVKLRREGERGGERKQGEGGSEEPEWGGALAELTPSVLAGTRIMGKDMEAEAERP